MRTDRRAFALIVVLIAIAAVFALSVRSAIVARTTVVETDALVDRARALRDGRSAAVLVLRGLVAADAGALDEAEVAGASGSAGAFGVVGGGGGADEEERPGIPDFPLAELLGLDDLEEEIDERRQELLSQRRRAVAAEGLPADTVTVRRTIDAMGLPGKPVEVELDGRVYRVTLRDAASSLDANAVDQRALRAYFAEIGLSEREARGLADRWLDWIDEDGATRSMGAEQSAYARDGVVVRNGPLAALEELRVLEGMTDAVFEHVRRDFGVTALGKVHASSASVAVLASLEGSSAELAREIVRAREEAPLTPTRLDALLPRLDAATLRDRLTLASSGVLRLEIEVADATSGAVTMRLDGAAVLSRRGIGAIELRVSR